MLSLLSYFNLLLSVVYFFAYLQNGNSWAISGLLIVVVFNWLTLRGHEKQEFQWSVLQSLVAVPAILFAVYIGYSAVLLIIDAVAHLYYPWNTLLLIASGLIFAFTIFFQLVLSYLKHSGKKM